MRVAERIRDSLLWRLVQWVLSVLRRLPESKLWYALKSSVINERLCKRMAQTTYLEQSFCFRVLQKLCGALHTFGLWLRPLWQQSCIARVVHWLKRKTKQSVFFGWAAKRGAPTFLLACLAFYPILESLFKFVFQLDALSNSWNEVLLAIGFLTVLGQRMCAKAPMQPCLTPAVLPLLQFPVVGLGLLCTVLLFPRIGLAGYYITMGGLLWFFIVTRILRGTDDFLYLCRMMVSVATAVALIGVLEYIFAIPIPAAWLETAETDIRTRAFAVFANPNQLGEYLELMIPLTIGMLYLTTDKKEKLRYGCCVLLMLAAGLFTMSRGAWIAITASLLLFALLEDRRLLVLFLIAGMIALMLPFVTSRLTFLFSNDYIYSAAKGGRVLRWQTALRYLRQGNPWIGLGFGMYGGEIANNHPMISDWIYYWVDNYYVKLLAENGIIGLLSFWVMQLGLLYTGLRAWARVRNTRYRALTAGMLSGLVGLLVHGMFECMLDVKFVSTLYWVVAAMMIWIGFLQTRNQTADETVPVLTA